MTLMPATAGGFADRPAVIAEGTWDGPEPVGNMSQRTDARGVTGATKEKLNFTHYVSGVSS